MEKYGNLQDVMVESGKEINQSWSIIRSGDAGGYQRLYNFLQKCRSITQSAQWNQLDTPDTICMLLAKLPDQTRDKLTKSVLSIRRRQTREHDLEDFIELMMDDIFITKIHNKIPNIKTQTNMSHRSKNQ